MNEPRGGQAIFSKLMGFEPKPQVTTRLQGDDILEWSTWIQNVNFKARYLAVPSEREYKLVGDYAQLYQTLVYPGNNATKTLFGYVAIPRARLVANVNIGQEIMLVTIWRAWTALNYEQFDYHRGYLLGELFKDVPANGGFWGEIYYDCKSAYTWLRQVGFDAYFVNNYVNDAFLKRSLLGIEASQKALYKRIARGGKDE